MIYLKSDGSHACNDIIHRFYTELYDTGTSVFNTGELVERIQDENPKIDAKEGTKLIDFTFITKLLSSKVEDLNRIDFLPLLKPAIDYIINSSKEIEYCILIPNLRKNDAASVRCKLISAIKTELYDYCKVEKFPSYYSSHHSNPYQFYLNQKLASFLSLDEELTNKLIS